MTIREAKELSEKLIGLGKKLMQNKEEAYLETVNSTSEISKVYEEFLKLIPELQKQGVEIPADILLAQLNNYSDAVKFKDRMMLSDCINYEIVDTVLVYIDILEQLGAAYE